MLEAYSVDQVRRAEAALMAVLPEGALMQRAAVGLAAECAGLLPRIYGSHVVAVVGSGDNGGDALYAAAWLGRRGASVAAVVLNSERVHGGGLEALRAAGGRVVDPSDGGALLRDADLVLDGVTGIGGRGGLRPDAARLFEAVDEARGRGERPIVVAVDVPSGVEADSGEVHGAAVRADVTVTFGAYKPGLLVSPGAGYAGECRFVDIGLAPYLEGAPVLEALEADDVNALLPSPERESDKYRRGVVGIVAGSAQYPGAAVLCVGAALRSGVGAVRFVGEGRAVSAAYPEVLVSSGDPAAAGRVQAWVVGPGLGLTESAGERLRAVLAEEVPALVDADGLTLLKRQGLSALAKRAAPTLVTPHAGEAERLLEDSGHHQVHENPCAAADPAHAPQADAIAHLTKDPGEPWERSRIEGRRLAAVRELAERLGCTVLLKGSTTLVAEPGRATVRVNLTGTPALATAGSGDVLSGLAGGLLAAGLSAVDAASVAAWRHGQAARRVEWRRGRRAPWAAGAAVAASDLLAGL